LSKYLLSNVIIPISIGLGVGLVIGWQAHAQFLQNERSSTPESISLEIPLNSESNCSDKLIGLVDVQIDKYDGDNSEVDFKTNPDASLFKTNIINTSNLGPNFAGKYSLAHWGCGTSCVGYSIVNAETGKIVQYSPVNEEYTLGSFEVTSNLLTLEPANAGMDRKYFMIKDTTSGETELILACKETVIEDQLGISN
jgi:hypothetical protein